MKKEQTKNINKIKQLETKESIMKRIFLTSLLATIIAVPALADNVQPNIAVGTNPADCTEPVLGTTSGTSNLQANWTANTLNLQWTAPDADNWSAQNNTCTYDSGITVPQTNPSRTGYTFAGWHVKTASNSGSQSGGNQTSFNLSTLDATIGGLSNNSKNFAGDYCYYYYYNEETEVENEVESETCEESVFSGLNTGEWETEFEYGTVKGIARCSTVSGSYAQTGNPTDDLDLNNLSNGARYCWCKATSYTPVNGSAQSVVSSLWAFNNDRGSAAYCASNCTYFCGKAVQNVESLRAGLFGSVAQ